MSNAHLSFQDPTDDSQPSSSAYPWVIEAHNLSKRYRDTGQEIQVLSHIELRVARAQTVAIVGASGSGKSTLLHLLGTLDQPTHGQLKIQGHDVALMNEVERSQLRNTTLGFVYQFHHLLPEFNALDNIAMPLILRRQSLAKAREQAQLFLHKVGLAGRARHLPAQLSGGERQRVALARALVTHPACVLADEPTGNLDRETAADVWRLMLQLNQESATAFVIVTHDSGLAQQCQKQLNLRQGYLAE